MCKVFFNKRILLLYRYVVILFLFVTNIAHAETRIRTVAIDEMQDTTTIAVTSPTNINSVTNRSECAIIRNIQKILDNMPYMALSTNMLYDAALVPNIGLKVNVVNRWSLSADWMGAWWGNHDKRKYWRIYGGDFDVNYRIGTSLRPDNPFAGHHLGVYASMIYYDIQGGIRHKGMMSAKFNYAVGLTYTYSLPVHRYFNIDFFIGAGYMWGKYKQHTPIDDHDVWLSTRHRSWFGPTRAGVNFVWVFGGKNRKTAGEGGKW